MLLRSSYNYYFIYHTYIYVHTYVHIRNTGNVDISFEAEHLGALSSVHQLDYSSVDNSTLQYCLAHHEAPDDRANKCYVSRHCNHRKRYPALCSKRKTTDKQCECIV